MPRYQAQIYYSGYVTIPVDGANEAEALENAREEAAQLFNRKEGDFTEQIIPTLEPWRDADQVELTG